MSTDGALEARAGTSGRIVRERFRATPESEARILLLIDAFSRVGGRPRALEGRVKLAKLDFLLRYPRHLVRVLALRGITSTAVEELSRESAQEAPLDARMMRYRYGPWDPSYYAVLGSLIGRGLVEAVPLEKSRGFGYRTTTRGATLAAGLAADASFETTRTRAQLLRRHLDLTGTSLKDLLYQLPEVSDATWHEELS